VQILEPTGIANGNATFNGQILDAGKSPIITSGFCYSSTILQPTIDNSAFVEALPNVSNNFSTLITGLRGATTYYIRAYAKNAEGLVYSNDTKSMLTPPIFGAGSAPFTDVARLQGSTAYFTIGNKAYLLGGDLGPTYTNKLWSYDALADQWLGLREYGDNPDDNNNVKWQAVAIRGETAYVLGGLGDGNVLKNDFHLYSSSSNIWSLVPSTGGPGPAYSRVGVTKGLYNLYYIGGKGTTALDEVWTYDFSPNAWVARPAFPVAQYGGIAVLIGDSVFAGMGKDASDAPNKTIWKSTDDLNSWVEEAICTSASGGILAGIAYKNKIYIIDESHYIFEYDPSTKLWQAKSRLPASARDVHGMFVLKDLIYIGLGGSLGGNKQLIPYDPSWDN
jgi:hypothetical protein